MQSYGSKGRRRHKSLGILSGNKVIGSSSTTKVSGDGLGLDDYDDMDFHIEECNNIHTPPSYIKPRQKRNHPAARSRSRGNNNNSSILSSNDPLSQAQTAPTQRPQTRHGNREEASVTGGIRRRRKNNEEIEHFYDHLEPSVPKKKEYLKSATTQEIPYLKNKYSSPSKTTNFANDMTLRMKQRRKEQVVDLVDNDDAINVDEHDFESSRIESASPLNHPGMSYESNNKDEFGKDDSFHTFSQEINNMEVMGSNERTNYANSSPVNNSNSRVCDSPDRRSNYDEEIDSPKHPYMDLTSANTEDAVCTPSKEEECVEITSCRSLPQVTKRLESKAKKSKATLFGSGSLRLTKAGANKDINREPKKRNSTGMNFLMGCTESSSSVANTTENEESCFAKVTPKRKRQKVEKENRQKDAGDEARLVLANLHKGNQEEQSQSKADSALNINGSPDSESPWFTAKEGFRSSKLISSVMGGVGGVAKKLVSSSRRKKKKGKPLNNTTLAASKRTDDNWTSKPQRTLRSANKSDTDLDDLGLRSSPFSTTQHRRQSSRLSKKNVDDTKGSAHNVPIEIIDSDEEEGEAATTRTEQEVESIDVARVTIGKKYSSSDCKLILRGNRFDLCYKTRKELKTHDISCEDITMMKFCFDEKGNDDDLILLVLRAKQTDENGLVQLNKSLLPSDDNDSVDLPKRGYIVLELRSSSALEKFFNWAITWPYDLCHYEDYDPGCDMFTFQRDKEECRANYAESMFMQIEKDNENRRSSLRTRSSSRKNNNSSNRTLVVFPFGGSRDTCLDRAARTLTEARQACEREEEEEKEDTKLDIREQSITAVSKKSKARSHVLTVREEDFERLENGEFLNDTLIDFWMQWIMRKEDRENSPVHIFSSHFYSSLKNDGAAAVESWTAKKNIDIFSKRFIFIPINESLHWSLCVVINPNHISTSRRLHEDELEQVHLDKPASCILFLDSLKAHKKTRVAKHVRLWLNSEWNRLKGETDNDVYTTKTMKVFSPRIPYQDNSWDCGVFVCRYAFALFMGRNSEVRAEDVEDKMERYVENNNQFNFNMEDIERIRNEMKCLIINLAVLYKEWAKEEKEAKAKAKLEEAKKSDGSEEEKKGGEKDELEEANHVMEDQNCDEFNTDMGEKNVINTNDENTTIEL